MTKWRPRQVKKCHHRPPATEQWSWDLSIGLPDWKHFHFRKYMVFPRLTPVWRSHTSFVLLSRNKFHYFT